MIDNSIKTNQQILNNCKYECQESDFFSQQTQFLYLNANQNEMSLSSSQQTESFTSFQVKTEFMKQEEACAYSDENNTQSIINDVITKNKQDQIANEKQEYKFNSQNCKQFPEEQNFECNKSLDQIQSEIECKEESSNTEFIFFEEQGFEKNNIDFVLKSNNIIKNIIKQYYNYLMKSSNSQLVSEFIIEKPISYSKKLIKKYFKGISYNNGSLIKLLKHEKYGRGLEYYLTFDACEELYSSKVQNIEEHISSISYLKKCCVNHDLLNNINFYKKKGKQAQL